MLEYAKQEDAVGRYMYEGWKAEVKDEIRFRLVGFYSVAYKGTPLVSVNIYVAKSFSVNRITLSSTLITKPY